MTKHTMEIDEDPKFLELVDDLRGERTRDEFFRYCFERGFIAALKEARPDLNPGGKLPKR